MQGIYYLGLCLVFGFVQANPVLDEEPVYAEDIKSLSGGRITGGWETKEGQIPFQISLRMIGEDGRVFSCGGSIIDPEWVITAAHCLANRISYVVRIGAQNLTRPAIILEETIENRVMHPEYDEHLGQVQRDDIALLKLSRTISWGPTIQPIRLERSEQKDADYSGKFLTVSGYGLTNDRDLGGTTSEVLMFVHLVGISNQECSEWFRIVGPQTVCARYYNNTIQSACSGDSGGPLTLVDEDGQPTMIGIVSFGSARGCTHGIPSAYVRPSFYQDWIYENTGINFDWSRYEKAVPEADSDVIIVDY